MARIEFDAIDDEMVERVIKHAVEVLKISGPRVDLAKDIREMLHVALTKPEPEPEILVSEEMVQAGLRAMSTALCSPNVAVAGLYRAMERQRIKEADKSPTPETADLPYTNVSHGKREEFLVRTVWSDDSGRFPTVGNPPSRLHARRTDMWHSSNPHHKHRRAGDPK